MGRVGPDPAVIARDLERLISGTVTAAATREEAAAASSPGARAGEGSPAVGGDDAMDFTKPG
jgi:hypothetical protein